MRRLHIGILDLVTKGPTRTLWARLMHPNLASIMPQAVGVWCEEAGHRVSFTCYTGLEDLLDELPRDLDLLFVSAFTQAAQLAYAVSQLFRRRGVVTALGGPHARCYPEDAQRYFDYVLGFTDRETVLEVLGDCRPHRPLGLELSAPRQPAALPGVRQRWRFIEATLAKAPALQIVPMIGSLGCPYTCAFCIDSVVDYQPLSFEEITQDLRFLLIRMRRPRVAWHDPNFGVRFDDYLGAIEAAAPPGRLEFIAESSLSLLSEAHLRRLAAAGFKAILPGIESWYDLGNKSKTGSRRGIEKVRQVAEHVNLICRYIPYVQTNFVLGLDCDQGAEPFELTQQFVDLAPVAFPGYSLLTAFGRAAPLNLEYQRAGRVLPFPFHFLNNNQAMNVRPRHYDWPTFYDHVIALTRYSFSWRAIARRFAATRETIPRWMNLVRAISSEGFGRIRYYRTIRRLLETDRSVRAFFEGETAELPQLFVERIRRDLGPLWEFLPPGALQHNPLAYWESARSAPVPLGGLRAAAG